MKKFILKWGKGSVLGIQVVYKTMTVKEKCIDEINPLIILPYIIKKRVLYVRKIYTSETKRNYDYGSYIDFIEAEEITEN